MADACGRKTKAEGRMRNAGLGKTPTLESAIKGLGAGACGCWGGTAKYAEYPKAKAKSRLGLSPSPSPSDGEGGRRPGEITARQEPRPTGWARRSAIPVGALHYQLKFLTVRNLISPTAASTYDYVSVNSLQCGNRGHGSASPPAPLHRMEYLFSAIKKAGVRISFRSGLERDRTVAYSWT